jgi:hypothetical protein
MATVTFTLDTESATELAEALATIMGFEEDPESVLTVEEQKINNIKQRTIMLWKRVQKQYNAEQARKGEPINNINLIIE